MIHIRATITSSFQRFYQVIRTFESVIRQLVGEVIQDFLFPLQNSFRYGFRRVRPLKKVVAAPVLQGFLRFLITLGTIHVPELLKRDPLLFQFRIFSEPEAEILFLLFFQVLRMGHQKSALMPDGLVAGPVSPLQLPRTIQCLREQLDNVELVDGDSGLRPYLVNGLCHAGSQIGNDHFRSLERIARSPS